MLFQTYDSSSSSSSAGNVSMDPWMASLVVEKAATLCLFKYDLDLSSLTTGFALAPAPPASSDTSDMLRETGRWISDLVLRGE